MAQLQIAPPPQRSSAVAVIASVVVLAIVAVAIFYFNPHKIAEFKVTSTDLYAPHTTFAAPEGPAGVGMHILGAATSSTEDNLYVIASVSLTDKLRLPLFINGITAKATFADGAENESTVLSASDLKRLEVIFPDITQHAVAPISDGDEIDPGQTRVGTLILPFPGQNADAWRNKKGASLTITLRNQEPQKIPLP